jgi:hypothetical protein
MARTGRDISGQDRGTWRAVVDTAMNIQVSIKCGEFFD